MPSRPPSPRGLTSDSVWTVRRCPVGEMDRMRAVLRSVTSNVRFGRNAEPHGICRLVATSIGACTEGGCTTVEGRAVVLAWPALAVTAAENPTASSTPARRGNRLMTSPQAIETHGSITLARAVRAWEQRHDDHRGADNRTSIGGRLRDRASSVPGEVVPARCRIAFSYGR